MQPEHNRQDDWTNLKSIYFAIVRVVLGQRPTHRNESQDVTPAKAGVHVREELDSRFRGNDVTFVRALLGWGLRGRPTRGGRAKEHVEHPGNRGKASQQQHHKNGEDSPLALDR